MPAFKKIYVEISNLCNLHCAFCPGTKRAPHAMTEAELAVVLQKLVGYTDFLYFHLMGEPLCHPQLERFLDMAGECGFKVILTTNGTLLSRRGELLLRHPAVHKVNVSLHAFEANDLDMPFGEYLDRAFAFGREAVGKKLVIYRLWNHGGADARNAEIHRVMEAHFPKPWADDWRGARLADKVYLDYGDKFDWPDMNAPDGGAKVRCYGLFDQLGVLCDGTVVPCCLDHEGDVALGNLHESDLGEILATERVQSIIDGFARGEAVEPLCRRCGYARTKFK